MRPLESQRQPTAADPETPFPADGERPFPAWAVFLAALVVAFLAIPAEGFWIDEGGTAIKAMQPDLQQWWLWLTHMAGSDPQMPVYMFLVWCWEKLAGSSEFALRCTNIPWVVVTALALRRVRFWPLVCLASPFVLYYAGEFRPYAMQIAGGALAASALGRVMDGEETFGGLAAVAGSSLLLAATSLTAAVWAGGLWAGVLLLRPDWVRTGGFWKRLAPWIPGFLLLGGYYAYALACGFRAVEIPGAGLLNVAAGFYELFGMLGLGPGKNSLRLSLDLLLRFLPILVPGMVVVGAAWLVGFRLWCAETERKKILACVLAFALPVLVLAVVGEMRNFRVMGRHLSPGLPAVLLPLACLLGRLRYAPVWARLLGSLVLGVFAASYFALRTSDEHRRDDYRQATALAVEAREKGKAVLWMADTHTARYYGLRWGKQEVVDAMMGERPEGLLVTDIVFLSRPEVFDAEGKFRAELRKYHFKRTRSLTAIEVWEESFGSR